MTRTTAATLGLLVLAIGVAAYSGRRSLTANVLSSNAPIAGVGGKTLAGRTADQREKVRPGMTEKDLLAALGEPTYRYETRGDAMHGRWVYEYADGKMLVTLNSAYIVEIDTTFK